MHPNDKELLLNQIRYAAKAKMTSKNVFVVADENHLLNLLNWLYLEYGIVGADYCRNAVKKINAKPVEYPKNIEYVGEKI